MPEEKKESESAPKVVITATGWINRADGTRKPITLISEEVPLEEAQRLGIPEQPKE